MYVPPRHLNIQVVVRDEKKDKRRQLRDLAIKFADSQIVLTDQLIALETCIVYSPTLKLLRFIERIDDSIVYSDVKILDAGGLMDLVTDDGKQFVLKAHLEMFKRDAWVSQDPVSAVNLFIAADTKLTARNRHLISNDLDANLATNRLSFTLQNAQASYELDFEPDRHKDYELVDSSKEPVKIIVFNPKEYSEDADADYVDERSLGIHRAMFADDPESVYELAKYGVGDIVTSLSKLRENESISIMFHNADSEVIADPWI